MPLSSSIGSPGVSEQARKSIGGHAVVGAVDAEDLLHHADLEQPGTGRDDHGHGLQRHVRQYGRKLAESDNPATRGEINDGDKVTAMTTFIAANLTLLFFAVIVGPARAGPPPLLSSSPHVPLGADASHDADLQRVLHDLDVGRR